MFRIYSCYIIFIFIIIYNNINEINGNNQTTINYINLTTINDNTTLHPDNRTAAPVVVNHFTTIVNFCILTIFLIVLLVLSYGLCCSSHSK